MTQEEVDKILEAEGVPRRVMEAFWGPVLPFEDNLDDLSPDEVREFAKFIKKVADGKSNDGSGIFDFNDVEAPDF